MAGKRRRDEDSKSVAAEDSIHPSRKRRVGYTEADKQLAKLYNDLADDVKQVRLKAAAELVRTVSAEAEKLDGVLTRLIKGLCSSRKAARSGFSVALTEVFRLTAELREKTADNVDLRVAALIERVVTHTEPEVRSNSQVSVGSLSSRERKTQH